MNKFIAILVAVTIIFTACKKEPITINNDVDIVVHQFDEAKFQQILDRLDQMEASNQQNSQEFQTALNLIEAMLTNLQQQVAAGQASQQDLIAAVNQLIAIANGNTAFLTQIIGMLGDLSDSVTNFTTLIQTSVIPQLAAIQQQGGSILSAVTAIGVNIVALQGNMATVLSTLNGLGLNNSQILSLLSGLASDNATLTALTQSNHTAVMSYLTQLLTAVQGTQSQVQQVLTAILLMQNDLDNLGTTLSNFDLNNWDDAFWYDLFDSYFAGINWNNQDTTVINNNITYIVGNINVVPPGLQANQIGEIVAYGVLMNSPATDNLAWFQQHLTLLNNWGYPINWYQAMLAALNNAATQNNTIAPTVVGQILTANVFNLSAGQEACLLCHLHSDFPSLGYGSNSDCVLAGGSGCN